MYTDAKIHEIQYLILDIDSVLLQNFFACLFYDGGHYIPRFDDASFMEATELNKKVKYRGLSAYDLDKISKHILLNFYRITNHDIL